MKETAVIQWMLSKIETVKADLGIDARIYSDKADKGAANPCLVWQVIGGDSPEVTDSGERDSGTLDVQLRFYAGTRPKATAAREALCAILQNVERETSGEIMIEGTSFAHGGDTFEKETEDYGAVSILAIHWATAATVAP
jgi:hypothetical protein